MRPNKNKKRVGLTAKIFIAVFAIYAAFTLVSLQVQINAKNQQQEKLQVQLESQKLANAQLEAMINDGNNKEYVADIARDMLDYVVPGEKVFVDVSGK